MLVAGLIAVVLLAACSRGAPPFKTQDISGVDWGGDFELTAHTGVRVKLADFRGRVVLLFFGYTHCPDICSPALVRLASARTALGAEAARVQVLFVSVDPEHDTPAQLAGFVPRFDATFIGLTGSAAEIAQVAQAYRVGYQKQPATGAGADTIIHSGSVFAVDTQGKLRLVVRDSAPLDDVVHDLRILLRN